MTTELESGVGNCFPGLEADLRNLDRRFFPYLAVDFSSDAQGNDVVAVAEVALARAQAELAAGSLLTGLTTVAAGAGALVAGHPHRPATSPASGSSRYLRRAARDETPPARSTPGRPSGSCVRAPP